MFRRGNPVCLGQLRCAVCGSPQACDEQAAVIRDMVKITNTACSSRMIYLQEFGWLTLLYVVVAYVLFYIIYILLPLLAQHVVTRSQKLKHLSGQGTLDCRVETYVAPRNDNPAPSTCCDPLS